MVIYLKGIFSVGENLSNSKKRNDVSYNKITIYSRVKDSKEALSNERMDLISDSKFIIDIQVKATRMLSFWV